MPVQQWAILCHNGAWSDAQHWTIITVLSYIIDAWCTGLSHIDAWCTALSHYIDTNPKHWALSYIDAWCTSVRHGCTELSHTDACCTGLSCIVMPDTQHWAIYWCLHSIEPYWCLHSIEPYIILISDTKHWAVDVQHWASGHARCGWGTMCMCRMYRMVLLWRAWEVTFAIAWERRCFV